MSESSEKRNSAAEVCPTCGLSYAWDGEFCQHCHGVPVRLSVDVASDAIVDAATWINRVLIAFATLAATVVLLKGVGSTEFEWQDVKLGLNNVWLAFSLLTCGYIYTTHVFEEAARELWRIGNDNKSHEAFTKITRLGGIFFRGLKLRVPRGSDTALSYRVPSRDRPTLLLLGTTGLACGAILDFSLPLPKLIVLISLTFLLLVVSWRASTIWVVALSELALPKSDARYLKTKHSFGLLQFAAILLAHAFTRRDPTFGFPSKRLYLNQRFAFSVVVGSCVVVCIIGVPILLRYFSE